MRAAIREIPDGVYAFEDFLDDCGPGTEPLRVAVTVTVDGDAHGHRLRGLEPADAVGHELLHQLHALVLVRGGEVPHRSARAHERGRAAPDHGDGARGLVPQSAPAGGRRAARDHLLPHVRGGAGRAGAGAARAGRRRRLALREPDLRRLGPRARAPLRRLRAGALGHGRARDAGRLRGDVVGVQRLQHPGGGAGGQPADRRRALRASSATRPAPERSAAAAASAATCASSPTRAS